MKHGHDWSATLGYWLGVVLVSAIVAIAFFIWAIHLAQQSTPPLT